MKLKIFSTQSGNRKPKFEALETEVNSRLEAHPSIVIEHTSFRSQPNITVVAFGASCLVRGKVVIPRLRPHISGWVCCYATMSVVLRAMVERWNHPVELLIPVRSGTYCTIAVARAAPCCSSSREG
jgi:hypothetical protein